jgi:glutaredoxin
MPAGRWGPRLVLTFYMALIPEPVRQQLTDRFASVLTGPVHLTLYTRPGSSRLILPAGLGCPTCEDARQMAELLRDAAPERVTLDVVDVSRDAARVEIDRVDDVPTIAIGSNSDIGRIRFQGLPTGTEFPALIDAVERVSRAEHGLSPESVAALDELTEPTELLVFATPT